MMQLAADGEAGTVLRLVDPIKEFDSHLEGD